MGEESDAHNSASLAAQAVCPCRVSTGGATTDRPIRGLLIADGLTVDAGRALVERGFGYLSLAAIGYRQHLRTLTQEPPFDPDATTVDYPQAAPPG